MGSKRFRLLLLSMLLLPIVCNTARASDDYAGIEAQMEHYVTGGKLRVGEKDFRARLEESPGDSATRYALGMIQILRAVENLAQNLHRYGLQPQPRGLPFVRVPVPPNADPERLTYDNWRAILQQLVDGLDTAAATLSEIDDPHLKLTVPVGMVRLDLDGNGEVSDEETFWKVFTAVAWRAAKLDEAQKRFPIGFDQADAHWMIGYSHLLRALAEILLAHDMEHFFRVLSPRFFAGAPQPRLSIGGGEPRRNFDAIADAITALHLARFEPAEPERLLRAHKHLVAMIAQSRLCWKHALAETDDDREWIPNARQTSLTPLEVTDEQTAAWQLFLDEAEAVLEGRKLIPHWRIRETDKGISLKRVFQQPRTLDIVLWATGPAVLPYVEHGEVVSQQTANNLGRAFQGRFLAFAVWLQ